LQSLNSLLPLLHMLFFLVFLPLYKTAQFVSVKTLKLLGSMLNVWSWIKIKWHHQHWPYKVRQEKILILERCQGNLWTSCSMFLWTKITPWSTSGSKSSVHSGSCLPSLNLFWGFFDSLLMKILPGKWQEEWHSGWMKHVVTHKSRNIWQKNIDNALYLPCEEVLPVLTLTLALNLVNFLGSQTFFPFPGNYMLIVSTYIFCSFSDSLVQSVMSLFAVIETPAHTGLSRNRDLLTHNWQNQSRVISGSSGVTGTQFLIFIDKVLHSWMQNI
jgi:hypothetical protein